MTDIDDHIPSCRPSFVDDTTADHVGQNDPHAWSSVARLKQPCIQCNRKRSAASTNLVCLWCSRYCHQSCWEKVVDRDDQKGCDYGRYQNIIVRPQWLHRVSHSPARFLARYPDHFDANNSSLTPLIVFINIRSGGQKGKAIYRQLIRLLNPRQVFQVDSDVSIKQALDIYSSLANTRICICGGDGTVGWVLSILAVTYPLLNNPPASICPLGTGNDLSRVLGWGWCYNAKQLLNLLRQSSTARPISLDRWQIDLESLSPEDVHEPAESGCRCFRCLLEHPKFVRDIDRPSYQSHPTPPNTQFSNYFSLGLDAAVVLDFHHARVSDPSKFTSPFKNKLLYLNISRHYFREFAFWRSWNLRPYLRLICDGKDITDSLPNCHTIVLLNITSYGSGTHPWERRSTRIAPRAPTPQANQLGRQDMGDRKLEVLALNSIQMALIHIGFRGHRLAQCNEVRIELIRPMPIHMDGEPCYLPASTAINVTHAGQVLVLSNEHR